MYGESPQPSTLSAISGAIPVVGGVVSNLINSSNIDKNNALNRQQYLEDRNWSREKEKLDWDRQNDYNSPVKQMQRLREAGLNPALMYGQASGNVAAPQEHISTNRNVNEAKHSADFGDLGSAALAGYINMRKLQPETNLMAAQTTNAITDAALKGFQQGLVKAQEGLTKSEKDIKDYYSSNMQGEEKDILHYEGLMKQIDWSNHANLAKYHVQAAEMEVKKLQAEVPLINKRFALDALITSANAKEAAVRILQMQAQMSKVPAEKAAIEVGIRKLQSEFYDTAINDHSSFYYGQAAHLVNSAATGLVGGTAAGAASRLFKGTKSIPNGSGTRNIFNKGSYPNFEFKQ